jgi:hypothetical protein
MRINEITSRDSFDRLKYDAEIFTQLNLVLNGIQLGADLEMLCESYLTIKRRLIEFDLSEDSELLHHILVVKAALVAEGGSRYLTETKQID